MVKVRIRDAYCLGYETPGYKKLGYEMSGSPRKSWPAIQGVPT